MALTMRTVLATLLVLLFAMGTSHARCFTMKKTGWNTYSVTCSQYSQFPDETFTITERGREREVKRGVEYLQERDTQYPFKADFKGKVFEGYTRNGLAADMCRCK